MSSAVWIGLATVRQRQGCDLLGKGAKGGGVNVLAPAASASQFEQLVGRAVKELGLILTELEECEPLSDRLASFEVDKSLLAKAREVDESGEVRFGTFHVFEEEGSS